MLLLLLPLGSCNDVVAAAKEARRTRPAKGGKRIEEPVENSLLQAGASRAFASSEILLLLPPLPRSFFSLIPVHRERL